MATTGEAERAARIVLRPVGSSLPLGMIGLAAASVVLSGLQLRWVPQADRHQVALVVLAFTVPLQLLASVFGFLARDSAGGTGMAMLAGTWAVTGTLTLATPPGSHSPVLGTLLAVAAVGALVPAAAAATGKVAIAAAFTLAAVRFALTGVDQLGGGAAWRVTSGWVGVALAALALYCALATELGDTLHREVLPIGRHGAGRRALDGGLGGDLASVQREAGVRDQL